MWIAYLSESDDENVEPFSLVISTERHRVIREMLKWLDGYVGDEIDQLRDDLTRISGGPPDRGITFDRFDPEERRLSGFVMFARTLDI